MGPWPGWTADARANPTMSARSQGRANRGVRRDAAPQDAVRRAMLAGAPAGFVLRPPWSLAADAFDRACTRCAKCIDACPTHVLKLAAGIVQVDYAEAECTFCGACVDICPEPAFDVAARASGGKPWHAVARIDASCLARLGVECDSCGDACEAGAIRFRVHAGPVPDPRVDSTRCTGCGACVRVCPATAIEVRAPTA
jgi:ferredoxin-type protein NapF